jgi:hypothetical protein
MCGCIGSVGLIFGSAVAVELLAVVVEEAAVLVFETWVTDDEDTFPKASEGLDEEVWVEDEDLDVELDAAALEADEVAAAADCT